jgi:hypothetical protein
MQPQTSALSVRLRHESWLDVRCPVVTDLDDLLALFF